MPFKRRGFNGQRQNQVNLESEGTADRHHNRVFGYGFPAMGDGANWLYFSAVCLFVFLDLKYGMVKHIMRKDVSIYLLGFAPLCVFI